MKAKLLTKPVALVTFGGVDSVTEGFAVIESPTIRHFEGTVFSEGRPGHDSGETVRGRRILVPLAAVTSITEFDTTSEVYEHRSRKPRRRTRPPRLSKSLE
jgi:hypothetical protein